MAELKYYIDGTQVYPLNASKSEFSFNESEQDGGFFTMEHSQDLIFTIKNSGYDFRNRELTDMGKELLLTIHRRCDNIWPLFWSGVFAVAEGVFDDDACTFTVKPRRKEFIVDDLPVNIFDTPPLTGNTTPFVTTRTGSGAGQRDYIQGIPFKYVLDYVVKTSAPRCQGVISNYFQINPTVVSSTILPGVTNKFTDIVVHALSDIQEPIPTNLDPKEFITFQQLLGELAIMFDIKWYIDENLFLRIEHKTFYETTIGFDLTTTQYKKYLKGTGLYKYDLNDYPSAESLQFGDSKQYARIVYADIAQLRANRSEEKRRTTKLFTDYTQVRYYGKNSSNDGLFLFSTTFSSGILYTMNTDAAVPEQNYFLTPEYLMRNIHTYTRPYFYGYYESMSNNNTGQTFYNGGYLALDVRGTKIQENIEFPVCCTDVIDLKKKIKTQYGAGRISQAVYDVNKDTLRVNLKHKITFNSSFLPNQLSGMQLWLRQDTGIVISGGKVSQWTDSSGNGRHFTQATSINRPTYDSVNKRVVVNYNEYLDSAAFQIFNGSNEGTIFIIGTFTGISPGSSSEMSVLSTLNVNPGDKFDITYAGTPTTWGTGFRSRYAELALSANLYYYTKFTPNGLLMVQRHSTGPIGPAYSTFHNGSEIKQLTAYNFTIVSNPWRIGLNPLINLTSGAGIVLNIAEIIAYNRKLTDRERQSVEFYLIKQKTFGIYP